MLSSFLLTLHLALEFSSNSPEIGKVVETVQADDIKGEDLKISF